MPATLQANIVNSDLREGNSLEIEFSLSDNPGDFVLYDLSVSTPRVSLDREHLFFFDGTETETITITADDDGDLLGNLDFDLVADFSYSSFPLNFDYASHTYSFSLIEDETESTAVMYNEINLSNRFWYTFTHSPTINDEGERIYSSTGKFDARTDTFARRTLSINQSFRVQFPVSFSDYDGRNYASISLYGLLGNGRSSRHFFSASSQSGGGSTSRLNRDEASGQDSYNNVDLDTTRWDGGLNVQCGTHAVLEWDAERSILRGYVLGYRQQTEVRTIIDVDEQFTDGLFLIYLQASSNGSDGNVSDDIVITTDFDVETGYDACPPAQPPMLPDWAIDSITCEDIENGDGGQELTQEDIDRISGGLGIHEHPTNSIPQHIGNMFWEDIEGYPNTVVVLDYPFEGYDFSTYHIYYKEYNGGSGPVSFSSVGSAGMGYLCLFLQTNGQ